MSRFWLAGLLVAMPGMAIWNGAGPPVPVDRLVTNLNAQVKEHPSDGATWLVLGRLHSFAYFTGSSEVAARDGKPVLFSVIQQPAKRGPGAAAHLQDSITAYMKAIELTPKEPLPYLGLAWVLEQPEAHSGKSLELYRKAYELAAPRELAMRGYAPYYEILSAEAADRIVAVLEERFKGKTMPAEVRTEVDAMRKASAQLKNKPRAITPLIFSYQEGTGLDALVAPERHVAFDLDGLGSRSWTWLQGATGILVWDPLHTGVVTDGRQLFGSATWWMFFRDGFQAIAALDDDHDGYLAGAELEGLAVWTDRNQNGIAEVGEVVPVGVAGIVRIAVTGGAGLANLQGIEFADGRRTPLYDWIAEPDGQTLTSWVQAPAETAVPTKPSVR